MPDAAFSDTQRQFLELLDTASPDDLEIEVKCYTMAGVPREGTVAARVGADYLIATTMPDDPPDVMIVTGSNPIKADVEDEPYWAEMVELLQWARDHVPSILLSCLAAHAALDVFDGVRREHLTSKFTGVFDQVTARDHPLLNGLASPLVLPHSRTNTVPDELLRAAGYDVAMWCDPSGWSVASRRLDECEIVLVQGHPEYDATSLLREYRRDARRFANHERDDEPPLPVHCVAQEDWPRLEALHQRLVETRDPYLLDTFDFENVSRRAARPWFDGSVHLYANWLNTIIQRSA